MKKKVSAALLPLVAIILLLCLAVFVVMGGALRKKQAESACDDVAMSAGATGASFTGDLGKIQMPFVGTAVYTSTYGMRINPGNLHRGEHRMHEGVDIAQTPAPSTIVSATKGKVKRVWTSSEGANVVTVDVGGNTTLEYIHLASFAPGLKAGDEVWPGRPVGHEGQTGNASGPHLHFQVNVNGMAVEPWAWMKAHGLQTAPSPEAVQAPLRGGPQVDSKPADAGQSAQPAAHSSASTNADAATEVKVSLPSGTAPGDEYTANPPLAIPADFLRWYQESGKKYGIPWQLLAGIGMAETGHGRNKAVSYANAQGPMQFLPQYFGAYATDADHNGRISITDVGDSIFAAGAKLVEGGAKKGPEGIRSAIFAYNHSQEYVNSVLSYAKYYAGGKVEVTASSGVQSASKCDVASSGGSDRATDVPASSAYEKAAIEAAKQYLGLPYVWGGGNQNGPTGGGFDCSGLTMYVVAQATKKVTGKELALSHLTSDQHVADTMATVQVYGGSGRVDTSHMRVGDVIIYDLHIGYRHPWNHAAIYIGNNKIIHAPNFNQPVTVADISAPGQGQWVARRPLAKYTGGGANPSPSASVASSQ